MQQATRLKSTLLLAEIHTNQARKGGKCSVGGRKKAFGEILDRGVVAGASDASLNGRYVIGRKWWFYISEMS